MEPYYIGIKKKKELRRSLLESSKEAIRALKAFERIVTLQSEKKAAIDHLRVLIKDIRQLSSKIKLELPKVDVSNKSKKKAKKTKGKKKLSDLEKLELELEAVEERLEKL